CRLLSRHLCHPREAPMTMQARRTRGAALAAAAAVILCTFASPTAAQRSRAEMVQVMDSIAESPVIEGRVAGLAVAVVRGSDTLLMKGYGKADLEWDVPMPVDAVFRSEERRVGKECRSRGAADPEKQNGRRVRSGQRAVR